MEIYLVCSNIITKYCTPQKTCKVGKLPMIHLATNVVNLQAVVTCSAVTYNVIKV
jgi:hypothetical protein